MAKQSGMTRRKDGRYQRQVSIDGKRVSFYGHTPAEVLRKIAAYEVQQEAKETYRYFAEKWYEEYSAGQSPEAQRWYLAPYRRAIEWFGEYRITDVSPALINKKMKEMAGAKYAKKTVVAQLSAIRAVLEYAILQGAIDTNFADHVKLPANLKAKKRDLPSDDDMQKVLDGLDKTFGLFPFLLLHTGARRGEAMALQYKDIDRQRGVIRIGKSVAMRYGKTNIKATKTQAGSREVPLLDRLSAVLPEGPPEHYIFSKDGGLSPLPSWRVAELWEFFQREAGTKITAHQLRHAYATMLYEAEIDEKMAQEILGHADITTTKNIYTHIRLQRKISAAERLNSYLSQSN